MKYCIFKTCLLIFINICKSQYDFKENLNDNLPVVELTTGYVRGKIINIYDPIPQLTNEQTFSQNIQAFLGIPYAESPTEENRFKPPKYKKRWNNIYNALKEPPLCPQEITKFLALFKKNINEDCLYLNVYIPNNIKRLQDIKLMPVVVYFHGGSYQYGWSSLWPPYKIVQKDVIFVSVNYRLGIFGFFTTGDKEATSNNGMRDQILALEWVRTNIRSFSGDSEKITIMGESVGGAAVGLHILSPLSGVKNYFSSAISISGTPISSWAFYRYPDTVITLSRLVARRAGCYETASDKLISCLRRRTVTELIKAGSSEQRSREEGHMNGESNYISLRPFWGPVIDGTFTFPDDVKPFLPENPESILQKSSYPKIPYLLGTTQNEDSTIVSSFYSAVYDWIDHSPHDTNLKAGNKDPNLPKNFAKAIRNFLRGQNITPVFQKTNYKNIDSTNFDNHYDKKKRYEIALLEDIITRVLYYAYIPWEDSQNKTTLKIAFTQLLTDNQFTAPMDKMAKMYSQNGGKTYLYVFNYRPPLTTYLPWQGVGHGVDMPFFFGAPLLNIENFPKNLELSDVTSWTQADRNVSSMMEPTPNLNLPSTFSPPISNPSIFTSFPYSQNVFNTHSNNPKFPPICTNSRNSLPSYWPPVKESHLYYLYIKDTKAKPTINQDNFDLQGNSYNFELKENYRQIYSSLWNGLVPTFLDGGKDKEKKDIFQDSSVLNAYSSYQDTPAYTILYRKFNSYRMATFALTAVCLSLITVITVLFLFSSKPCHKKDAKNSTLRSSFREEKGHDTYDHNNYFDGHSQVNTDMSVKYWDGRGTSNSNNQLDTFRSDAAFYNRYIPDLEIATSVSDTIISSVDNNNIEKFPNSFSSSQKNGMAPLYDKSEPL
ncbi:carboxylesterase 1E-like isoform X2 [Gordionus sp. m RMFG-2023]|uniref:carboxylesterase 1E-like isoform X2 n=1 Tax=Gordionus sp. m RMFG-2023 TaxID=3053472 RepID=UPI0031FC348C